MSTVGRFWEFLLTAGEYADETRDHRGRRRVVVALMWISVLGLALGALGGVGGWGTAMDVTKASAHLLALLALWARPRRIAAIFLAMSTIDLAADVTLTLLYGGLYDSGLQILWSLVPILGLLVISTVRVAAVFFAGVLAAVAIVGSVSVEATHQRGASPEQEATMTIVLVALFVFIALFYFVRQRDRFQRESDDLLQNILPDEIATRLKVNPGGRIADHFDDVSVLFLDVAGFTPMSAAMSPTELVGLLDDIFSDVDRLVEELGVEKIKTVGDEYMVAAGVPTPRADHAEALAELALLIQDRLAAHTYDGHHIVARIGINSGPVVAGIIGTRKFSYDLWGDVVNTASRMESHGVPGRIQISASTYEHLRDRFVCEHRGTLEVKGKGKLETWFLQGRRDRDEKGRT
jgi:guanylate cyclase